MIKTYAAFVRNVLDPMLDKMTNIIELILVPDLLLFGRFNSLVALAYITVVAWAGFRPGKR